jgi:methylase of polypeptide subunit release factors
LESSKTRKSLQALTVNDTTSGKVAFRHLRGGRALVYTGGDYHNARQLYAIACSKANVQRFGFSDKVDLVQADLFPATATTTDIEESNKTKYDVLFNPTWVPGTAATKLDQAVYDTDQNVLRRFLLQAQHHVNEDGDVYLLLSNL